MYTVLATPARRRLMVRNELVSSAKPILEAIKPSLKFIESGEDLSALIVEMFMDDSDYAEHPSDVRQHAAFILMNLFACCVDDMDEFVESINHDLTVYKAGFEVRFDKGFYPAEQGHFFDRSEFVHDAA